MDRPTLPADQLSGANTLSIALLIAGFSNLQFLRQLQIKPRGADGPYATEAPGARSFCNNWLQPHTALFLFEAGSAIDVSLVGGPLVPVLASSSLLDCVPIFRHINRKFALL
jgi:hypothetical protein